MYVVSLPERTPGQTRKAARLLLPRRSPSPPNEASSCKKAYTPSSNPPFDCETHISHPPSIRMNLRSAARNLNPESKQSCTLSRPPLSRVTDLVLPCNRSPRTRGERYTEATIAETHPPQKSPAEPRVAELNGNVGKVKRSSTLTCYVAPAHAHTLAERFRSVGSVQGGLCPCVRCVQVSGPAKYGASRNSPRHSR